MRPLREGTGLLSAMGLTLREASDGAEDGEPFTVAPGQPPTREQDTEALDHLPQITRPRSFMRR